MGALEDNLDVLDGRRQSHEVATGAPQQRADPRVKVKSLNFMRGRTFLNKLLIIDEAQNGRRSR